MLSELAIATGDGSYSTLLLRRLAHIHLLILDDWGLAQLPAAEARYLLEVIDDRRQTRTTIVATQLPIDQWHAVIADALVADAILDRLVHNALLRGESMRKSRTSHAVPGHRKLDISGQEKPTPSG